MSACTYKIIENVEAEAKEFMRNRGSIPIETLFIDHAAGGFNRRIESYDENKTCTSDSRSADNRTGS